MRRVAQFLFRIDICVVVFFFSLSVWLFVTFKLPQKRIEQTLLIMGTAFGVANAFLSLFHFKGGPNWTICFLNFFSVGCFFKPQIEWYRLSALSRIRRLAGPFFIVRILAVVIFLMFSLTEGPIAYAWIGCMVLFMYVAANPRIEPPKSGGKLSMSKIKELFGSWALPQPEST